MFRREMTSWPPSQKYDFIENPIPPIDVYLFEEHFCQILSRSGSKRRRLGLFEEGHPKNKNNNKMSSDMRSVPDL